MCKKLYFISFVIIVLVGFFNPAISQHQDCNTANYFEDSLGQIVMGKGYGKTLEIRGYSIKNELFFTKEHNTYWAVVHFTQEADFQFELVPQFADDDFDFIIFDYYSSSCDSILKKTKKPIRSNLSKRMPESGSKTGLKDDFTNNFAAAGPNSSFSAPLHVNAGDSILIVFDSPYGSKGDFTIVNYSNYYPVEPEIAIEIISEPRPLRVTLLILDENKQPISNPAILVKSLSKDHRENPQIDEDGNVYSEYFKSSVQQLVIASQKGYLFQKFNFKWDGESDSIVALQLTRLKKGAKLQMENILFVANSAQITSSSKGDLDDLLFFLVSNPTMEIEIGGHVHGPKKKNIRKYRKLSEDRASAVYQYLIEKGIASNRLSVKGYGNSEMIYRPAKNETQISANRRVEITITKIE